MLPWSLTKYNDVYICILYTVYQVLQSDLVSSHKWPLQGLSDLDLGNQKVTLKKLVYNMSILYLLYIFMWKNTGMSKDSSTPLPSMYGIFTYIYHKNKPFM